MKLSKYKILFISPFTDKSWQIEFTRFTFIASLSALAISLILTLILLFMSSPIIKEYFRISAINNEIKHEDYNEYIKMYLEKFDGNSAIRASDAIMSILKD